MRSTPWIVPLVMLVPSAVLAGTPVTVGYNGVLFGQGECCGYSYDGPVTVGLFDSENATTPVVSLPGATVKTDTGYFHVDVQVDPADLAVQGERWLGLTLTGAPGDPKPSFRMRLVAVPLAASAATVQGQDVLAQIQALTARVGTLAGGPVRTQRSHLPLVPSSPLSEPTWLAWGRLTQFVAAWPTDMGFDPPLPGTKRQYRLRVSYVTWGNKHSVSIRLNSYDGFTDPVFDGGQASGADYVIAQPTEAITYLDSARTMFTVEARIDSESTAIIYEVEVLAEDVIAQ